MCIIIDKCIYTSSTIKKISTINRHINTSFILSYSNIYTILPTIRQNADYVFISKESNSDTIQKLYERFFSFLELSDFKYILQEYTTDYKFLVLDNINNDIFYYKAKNHLYSKDFFYELTHLWSQSPNKNNKVYKNGGPLFWQDYHNLCELTD